MSVFDIILCVAFCCGVFLIGLASFYVIIILPIVNHGINKENHKIQWKCEKTRDQSINSHYYNLYYRTLPSELNGLQKIFGENRWIHVEEFDESIFFNKGEFINFVKSYETRKDIKDYINEANSWTYP